MTSNDAVKRGLLLLGSFAIAYNASEFLHELGHALAAWMTGGQVFGIVVHPFNWSFCYAVSPYPLFLTAAGVTFLLSGWSIDLCVPDPMAKTFPAAAAADRSAHTDQQWRLYAHGFNCPVRR